MTRRLAPLCVLALSLGCAGAGPRERVTAQYWAMPTGAGEAVKKGEPAAGEVPLAEERTVESQHRLELGGHRLAYTATAGTMFLQDGQGQPTASVFYVSYVKDGGDGAMQRPVTFVFNGGPGSSAVWLQMGTFGPRRVAFPDAVAPEPPPYEVVDNAHSLLDVTDLVFIDPVGTGYSRPLGKAKPEEFQGVTEDVRSVGEFIRLWTARNGRWNSPRFLAGESYGTTRAAALVNHLQGEGMFFNGVILVSAILDFQTARFEPGNDLPYILFLPTYAATAWYHGALKERSADLGAFLDEVRTFARTEYALALMEGARLDPARRKAVIERLARYTGLSPAYLEQTDLRIQISRFTKELRRTEGRTVGRLDSRYVGLDADAAGEGPGYDPSYAAILGPYTAAMNHYLRAELGFVEDRKYEILSGEVNRRWNWEVPGRAGYVNVAEDLATAMRTNPHLRIFVANGYYDLATPFFATEYTVDHLRVPAELRPQISMGYYEAGHMMYLHEPSLAALKADLGRFFGEALAGD